MPQYKTPGVFIEEIAKLPPSVAAVDTAVPVFIGFTQKAVEEDGTTLKNLAKRITSLLEYERFFGTTTNKPVDVKVTGSGSDIKVEFDPPPGLPAHFLYYSMQMFYANGGGPCYVISIGDFTDAGAPTTAMFTGAIAKLEAYDEPTLLVFPDACLLGNADHRAVVEAALAHCNKMQDRFTIADVRDALPGTGHTDENSEVTTNFRAIASGPEALKYGAAYFPYLNTALPFLTDDATIKITTATNTSVAIANNTFISAIKSTVTDVYNAVKRKVAEARVTLPPSGAVAGAYARTDASRGVWKAPANVGLVNVIGPAVAITDDLNSGLNVDASGKSVNAIRAFTGRGTLIWGARTLAGNDNENRYVPVRRFLIFAEESIKKATGQFVFEPNDANTWVKVRGMIENFLTLQWRDGALAGAKPEDAFYVSVGLNKTMSAQDILEGRMIVEIGLAIVRPAEFIILRFVQLMQKS